MEAFIERSNALLQARPDTTQVSMRYTHKKAAAGGERVDPTAKPAKAVIKTQDKKTGMVYKYKVRKAHDLSRILASLGPQFFEFEGHHKTGMASIMSGVAPHEVPQEAEKPAEKAAEKPADKKKKKSKKH